MNFFHRLSRDAWDRFFIVRICCLLLLLLIPLAGSGQFKFREPPNRQDPAALGEREGKVVWEQFINNRSLGSFELEGKLTYRPGGAPSQVFGFHLQGEWRQGVQQTTIELFHPDGRSFSREVVLADGVVCENESEGNAHPVDPDDLDAPVFEAMPFSWADLLMLYLHWRDVTYQGPDRYLGRPAHRFRLVNPGTDGFPASVVVTLDEDYAALLKAELYNTDARLVKRIRVGGFKQYNGQWMFSSLFWEHRITRSSVRLDVDAFILKP